MCRTYWLCSSPFSSLASTSYLTPLLPDLLSFPVLHYKTCWVIMLEWQSYSDEAPTSSGDLRALRHVHDRCICRMSTLSESGA